MSQQQLDKFLLVDAKTAAKQADDIKAKQDAKLKEELLKKQAETLTKIKIEIADHVNQGINLGMKKIMFKLDKTMDEDLESAAFSWLTSLGYKASFVEAHGDTFMQVEW